MDSYENEQTSATMSNGMRRTVIPGIKLANHEHGTSQIPEPTTDDATETRRFTPVPLQNQGLRAINLPQINKQRAKTDDVVTNAPSINNEAVTNRQILASVKDQDMIRRLHLQVDNDLDEELTGDEQWRDNLADLADKQPLNPQIPRTQAPQPAPSAQLNTAPLDTVIETVDPAAQALAKAREDAFKLWESQASSLYKDKTPANQDTAQVSYPRHTSPSENNYVASNMDQPRRISNDYPNAYQPADESLNDMDYQLPQRDPVYSQHTYANEAAHNVDFNYHLEQEADDNNERFQAYDTLVANPEQAAYAYQNQQDALYENQIAPDHEIENLRKANVNMQRAEQPSDIQTQEAYQEHIPTKYEQALSNETGLLAALLTSGNDLVNLFKMLFTNFPEDACRKIGQAKSMAFVPAALLYFVLYLIFGSVRLLSGGWLTSALTGQEGLSVWASLLVTILTAVCHIVIYTLIFVLANYLSYHKRTFLSVLNCVAALLLLQACFAPLIFIFNLFAAPIASLLSTLKLAWAVLLTDKFVRQQGSLKFSKQADLVALIIASLVALLPTLLGIFF